MKMTEFLSRSTGSRSRKHSPGPATRTRRAQRLEAALEVDASRISRFPGRDHARMDRD